MKPFYSCIYNNRTTSTFFETESLTLQLKKMYLQDRLIDFHDAVRGCRGLHPRVCDIRHRVRRDRHSGKRRGLRPRSGWAPCSRSLPGWVDILLWCASASRPHRGCLFVLRPIWRAKRRIPPQTCTSRFQRLKRVVSNDTSYTKNILNIINWHYENQLSILLIRIKEHSKRSKFMPLFKTLKVILVSLDLVVSSSLESVRPLIWRPFAVDKSPTSSDSSTLISPRYM